MICPNDASKDFDDLDCQECKWYFSCFNMWQDGNIFGKEKTKNNEGDNFPVVHKDAKKENKSPTDVEKLIINALAQEIKDYGEDFVFNNLNTMELEKRLDYLEFFFSAKRLLATGEY